MSLISANTTLFCLIDKIYFNPLISESEHYQKINIAMRIKERLWVGQYIIWNSNTEWIDLKINTSCNFTESISRVVHWSFPYNPSIKMFISLKVHGKFIHTTYITWHNMCPEMRKPEKLGLSCWFPKTQKEKLKNVKKIEIKEQRDERAIGDCVLAKIC